MAVADARIVLRRMERAHLRQVHRIERAAYGDAWPRTAFERELRNDLAHYIVAVEAPPEGDAPQAPPSALTRLRRLFGRTQPPERVLGFAGVWFTRDQLHLVTIAVDAECQGRGIARRMLVECFELAADAGLRTVALEVRPSNERAIRIYERFGFQHAGRLTAYYADNGEDAIVMVTPDVDAAEFRRRVDALRAEHGQP